jgi:hypothetical protein
VNFASTLAPRILAIAIPIALVLAKRAGVGAYAPLALALVLLLNVALEHPLNVAFQWRAFTRTAHTASLDAYLDSPQFVPGATYRVLRGAGDAKLGLYHVLLAGGRLDSEMFPESMAMRDFANRPEYEALLCARHVDTVIAYDSYRASRHTNELDVLQQLAADPSARVRVEPIERGPGHVVYRVDRAGCPAR